MASEEIVSLKGGGWLSKGKHLQKEELWIRLERVMMARQEEDVTTEDTVRWIDTKAEDADKACQ